VNLFFKLPNPSISLDFSVLPGTLVSPAFLSCSSCSALCLSASAFTAGSWIPSLFFLVNFCFNLLNNPGRDGSPLLGSSGFVFFLVLPLLNILLNNPGFLEDLSDPDPVDAGKPIPNGDSRAAKFPLSMA
jgi:hypothetical protein